MNRRRKKQKLTPEAQFRATLDHCSRTKNLFEAISLYESSDAPTLSLNNLNSLLYICSNSVSDPETREPAIEFGFKLFHQNNGNLKPNEATITALSRLAAAKGDGDYAFELAKRVNDHGVAPKLRTFSPALICFCDAGMADKAYEVEEHVQSVGLQLEEPELVALLKVSMEASRLEKVYEYLHKLRGALRGVNQPAMEIIANWFQDNHASEVGSISLDLNQVKEALLRNGGGWHGLGWLGEGDWIVRRSNIAADGKCCACGEQLVCGDIDRAETEKFAQSIASFAMEREIQSNFKEFQDWLEQHSDYETVIDGANIGLYQQNFAEGGFSIEQLDAVIKEVHNCSMKWPLVVLHKKRVRSLLEDASKRALIQEWIDKGVLYGTPYGSNDDWYWLYATVKLKCLLVTNDEMRDHIFALLGSNFFFRWKERHQDWCSYYSNALKTAVSSIASNAGKDGFEVVEKLLARHDPKFGYNAAAGLFRPLHKTCLVWGRVDKIQNKVVGRVDKSQNKVRYTFVKSNLKLLMPPSYSLVIQESEKGSWHVPSAEEASDECFRTWLCVTRYEAEDVSYNNHISNDSCINGGDTF